MNREELIAHLVSCGFQAQPRDWAMGQTVFVTRITMQVGPVMASPGATYCWTDGREFIALDPPGRELRYATVGALVDYLNAHFAAAEAFWTKPEKLETSG